MTVITESTPVESRTNLIAAQDCAQGELGMRLSRRAKSPPNGALKARNGVRAMRVAALIVEAKNCIEKPTKPAVSSRARGQAASLAARRANAVRLRRDFLDDAEWVRLAKLYNVRLPNYGSPPTPGKMRAWLRQIGRSEEWYLGWAGYRRLSDFARANPDWPFRAWAGMCLEQVAREDGLEGGGVNSDEEIAACSAAKVA